MKIRLTSEFFKDTGAEEVPAYVKGPATGPLQPDSFGVHYVGYTNLPIPEFSGQFVDQFMRQASEKGISKYFTWE